MKVKFINDDPTCSSSDVLELGKIYESDLYMDSDDWYFIEGNFHPKEYFQIIEK